jgi:hypothetical protein
MEEDEEKRYAVEGEEERRSKALEEVSIGLRALNEGAELPEIDHREEGHENTRELTQDKAGVGWIL